MSSSTADCITLLTTYGAKVGEIHIFPAVAPGPLEVIGVASIRFVLASCRRLCPDDHDVVLQLPSGVTTQLNHGTGSQEATYERANSFVSADVLRGILMIASSLPVANDPVGIDHPGNICPLQRKIV